MAWSTWTELIVGNKITKSIIDQIRDNIDSIEICSSHYSGDNDTHYIDHNNYNFTKDKSHNNYPEYWSAYGTRYITHYNNNQNIHHDTNNSPQ